MKRISILTVVTLLLFLGSQGAVAGVTNGPNINGYTTFQDTNTGRIWLDLDNFFNMSVTDMVSAANSAGFTFAIERDVSQLTQTLPLNSGQWSTYAAIMGSAPNRGLMWGAYNSESYPNVQYNYAFAYDTDNSWTYQHVEFAWNVIPNQNTAEADMNIWAYQTGGNNNVPEPATMLLFGLGLVGLASVRRIK